MQSNICKQIYNKIRIRNSAEIFLVLTQNQKYLSRILYPYLIILRILRAIYSLQSKQIYIETNIKQIHIETNTAYSLHIYPSVRGEHNER